MGLIENRSVTAYYRYQSITDLAGKHALNFKHILEKGSTLNLNYTTYEVIQLF